MSHSQFARSMSALDEAVQPDSLRERRHILHVFPTFAIGGVPIRIATIINHFGSKYRHTITSLDGRWDTKNRLERSVEVDLLPFTDAPRHLFSRVKRIRKVLTALRPDLLMTYNWGSIEWAFTHSLFPVGRHIHLESGFGPEEADRPLWRRSTFRRLALRRASRLIVPSHTLVRLASRHWGQDPAKITLIPNGVDVDRFAAPAGVAVCGEHSNTLVVGTVAPLRREKNLKRLLQVFAETLPQVDARLFIVGDGPERAELMRSAEDLGIAERTTFTGHVEHVERALVQFDVFALTSDTEQMPNSLIQAMAAGRPVAAVDVGDVKHMLSPENREFVVAKNDTAGLTRVLVSLLGNRELRTDLGRHNQDHVRSTYSLDRMLRAYEMALEA